MLMNCDMQIMRTIIIAQVLHIRLLDVGFAASAADIWVDGVDGVRLETTEVY